MVDSSIVGSQIVRRSPSRSRQGSENEHCLLSLEPVRVELQRPTVLGHRPHYLVASSPRQIGRDLESDGDVGADAYGQALDAVEAATPISLYVHIPFCEQICWYCGCNTGAANRTQRLEAYLEAMGREIDLVAGRLAGRAKVRRIAFGGGSPNAMPAEAFVALAERLRRGA